MTRGICAALFILPVILADAPVSAPAAQARPSPRYCAAEAGQGRFPQGCPRPPSSRNAPRESSARPPANPGPRPGARGNRYLAGVDLADLLANNILCAGFRSQDRTCTEILNSSMMPNSTDRVMVFVLTHVPVGRAEGERLRSDYNLRFVPLQYIMISKHLQRIRGDRACIFYVQDQSIAMIGSEGQRIYIGQDSLERFTSRHSISSRLFLNRCSRYRRRAGQQREIVREWLPAHPPEILVVIPPGSPAVNIRPGSGG